LATIEIREVRDRAGLTAFNDAAYVAQATNPHWVAPARMEVYQAFDPKRSPLMRENTVRAFVAFDGARPIGRIATVVNPAYLEKYGNGVGHFGLVDAIDDASVFAALLDTAAASLRTHGLSRMQGPFSLSINHESGVLVDGFEHPHVVRTNHSPPFYSAHLEAAGCHKVMDLRAASCRVAESDFPKRVAKLVAASKTAAEIETRGLSFLRWTREFPLILDLYNDAWSDNWGAVPVGRDEAAMIAHLMLPVSKPAWIRVARRGGEPIAIVAQIPDVNEALAGLDGRLLPFGWAKLLARIHLRGTKRARIPMIGVTKRWRGTRVGSLAISMLLAEAITQAQKAGVEETEISWMLEHNRAVLNLVASLPAYHTRTFRIYERAL
jgi:GNAT superfamily N-acetyltransferase